MKPPGKELPFKPAAGDLAGAGADAGMAGEEDCIPLSALAMPDSESGDQMANPEVGDPVSYQVDGRVTRVEGDNAYVKRESVNGQPIDKSAGEEPGGDQGDSAERGELDSMAKDVGGLS